MQDLIGKRIKLLSMMNDPRPIEVGSEGIVTNIGFGVINVKWDNGRNLGLIEGVDVYEVLD